MRAHVLRSTGEALVLEDLAQAEPQAGEVLVRVAACGVCHTDLHVITGEVAFPTPGVLGHEISGWVEALGPGVEGLSVGDRVTRHAVTQELGERTGAELIQSIGNIVLLLRRAKKPSPHKSNLIRPL